jgi:cysteine desulfurase
VGSPSARSAPPIYLDHHATTPTDPRVVEAMAPYWSEDFGNAASRTHVFGWRAEAALELAREQVAEAIGAADPREIVFTSGATESDNLALQGVAAARRRGHLVISAVEHPAVSDTAAALERRGFPVSVAPVDGEGRVDAAAVAALLREDTVLVSIQWAQSEIGTLQAVPELAALCRERGVAFHTDAAQAVGKVPVDVRAAGCDLLSLSAHKLYGPKGIGALYVRRGRPRVRIEPILHGGGHEHGLRSGTVPVALVVGLARALRIACEELAADAVRLAALRDRMWERLSAEVHGISCNGPPLDRPGARLPGNLHVSIEGVAADALVARLPEVALSTGSACSSAKPEPSPVLRALGLPDARVRGGVRIGIGRGNTESEIDRAAALIAERAAALRAEGAASRGPGAAATLAPSGTPKG